MSVTYKSSGVDIDAGNETVKRIKPLVRSTFNSNVLSDIGLFGGLYSANFEGFKDPVLVGSTDGVGTKLIIAFKTGIHETVGQDLVNHCVNDILCCGAKPLFFLDYFGCGKLQPTVAEKVISGFVKACNENGVALIGGETAEMPSLYKEGEYDLSGTIVGIVEKNAILNGKQVKEGNILIGLPSTGLHTNGFSLARNVLLPKFELSQHFDELGTSLGKALLAVHKSYYNAVYPLLQNGIVNGVSHITGGGIVDNTNRIVPEGLKLNINWSSWQMPPIFKLIQNTGNIGVEEMRRVFNIGVGLIVVCDKNNVDSAMNDLKAENPFIMGEIEKA